MYPMRLIIMTALVIASMAYGSLVVAPDTISFVNNEQRDN